ncbi:amino acid ABC transporter substrate-binding protein (PAAT family) [Rhizobium subbaraonis]|uniref:Amino acid ABC transporter substrate-binding protein (PAAT family) n=1 Tax=Rhizobium subbaraonis TaxID=908946 RepID=A0A285UZE8_9HYPH|nr:amino acid ABC transporter substrate-binding protein (PAAT family) [Rhizobium subbaraonis]
MRQAGISSRKICAVIALCVSWLATAPAGAADAEAPAGLPASFDSRERIAKPDLAGVARLRFLTSVDFPPFNFIDQAGKLTGFHVDLVREICRELDLTAKCQIQAMPFAELRENLEKDAGEAVIAGVAVTTGLRRDFIFSRPYMRLPARFIVRSDAGPANVAVLAGRPVGVARGSVHEAMLSSYFPTHRPVPFETQAELLQAVKDKKVDAAFGDGLQLAFWSTGPLADKCCRLLPGAYLSETFLGEGLTIMTRRDEPAISGALDHALLSLSRSGRLAEIYLRYFPVDIY